MKFTLTPAGEYFYSQSKGILEEVDDIRRETIRIGQDDELQLLQCGCYAELSVRSHLSSQETVELENLKRMPCILISSREQQNTEQDYFQNTLGFGGKFLFAENLEEGRLMVAGNRGFRPIESAGTLPPAGTAIKRLPIVQNGRQLQRNYCVFWLKEQTNYYIEEFAAILRKLLTPEDTQKEN